MKILFAGFVVCIAICGGAQAQSFDMRLAGDYSFNKLQRVEAIKCRFTGKPHLSAWTIDDAAVIAAIVADEISTATALSNPRTKEAGFNSRAIRLSFKFGGYGLTKAIDYFYPCERRKTKWVKRITAGVLTGLTINNFINSKR